MKRNVVGIALLVGVVVAGFAWMRFAESHQTAQAEIREVWEHHEMYEGRSLRVSGTLKRFLAGRPREHFVVEGPDGYRIGVEAAGLESLQGVLVDAQGLVTFDEEQGLRLEEAWVRAR